MLINKVNSYVKATFFYIIGNGVGQGLMLLSTIVFTRIMSKEGYGQYSTYYSFVAIMTTFIGASLNSSINNAYIDFKSKARDYRASILALATIIAISLSIIFFVFNLIFGSPVSPFLVVMACIHSFSFLSVTIYNNSANMENKYIKKCILLMLPNILQISFSIIFLLCLPTSELNARVIGSTLGVGVCACFVYICMVKGHKKIVNKTYWKYGLKISLPLIFSAISYSIMSQSDNIMITAFKGADVTAVYSLIYYVSFIIYAIMEATNPVLQAWLYRSLDKKDLSNVKLIQKWYLFLYAIIAIFIMMIAPELIKILSPKGYWEFNYIGPFVLSSYLMVMYSFYSMEITFFKKTIYVAVFVA
ncbi:MAG: oligosaccharide flippase family protein, partial [Ruminococcus sp.]|nr:oligosaccharide flippase family protein [Ruminococcus sp.]